MANTIDNHTKILLHGDAFEDASFYKIPITNDGVQISSAQSKFGGTSFYFNGASKLTFPQTTHQFGSGDFTIEWWEYSTASSNGSRFCSEFSANTCGGILLGYMGHQVYISSVVAYNWDIVSGVSMLNVTANQWVHWAFVRSGNTLRSYRNGALYATTTMGGTGNVVYDTQFPMVIGDYRTGDHSYFTGYIDEFRIVDYAVYTSNFTPPTEPYSSSIGTVDVGNKKKILKGYTKVNNVWKPINLSKGKINNTWKDLK